MGQIDKHLAELITLWVDGSAESLRKIPVLCGAILACDGENFHPQLLRRAKMLAQKGQERLRTCVEIQRRTGAYSPQGALEVSARIVTTGWEA